jgi:hypothetical protein
MNSEPRALSDCLRTILPHVGREGRLTRYWDEQAPSEVTLLVAERFLRADGVEIHKVPRGDGAIGAKRYCVTPSGRAALENMRRADGEASRARRLHAEPAAVKP